MQTLLFKRTLNANRLLTILKRFDKGKHFHLQARSLKLKWLNSSDRLKLLPILSSQLSFKYKQLFLVYDKVQSILTEKWRSFDLFSKSSPKNNQNTNKNQNENGTPPPLPPPQRQIINLLISIASFYLAYSLLRDFERLREQNQNQHQKQNEATGVVPDGSIKINISQKAGNTFGNY
jgi:hypothetical protein